MMEPLTAASLCADLRALGVAEGMILGVHSSLSSLGCVQGGAPAVIEALARAVGPEGALMMLHDRFAPAAPLDATDRALGLAWKVRRLPWGDLTARTGMGRIADTFAQRPDVARGPGRQWVLVARGPHAGRLCQIWGELVAAHGRILLLGVHMDRCSILHGVESRVTLPPDIARRVFPPLPPAVAARFPAESWACGMRGAGLDFMQVEALADAAGLLTHGTVGRAPALLFDPAPVLDLFEAHLRAEPERFLYDSSRDEEG